MRFEFLNLKFAAPVGQSEIRRFVKISSNIVAPVIASVKRHHHFTFMLNCLKR